MNRLLIIALRDELARAADPAKAPAMQAYMKSAMPFRGIQMPKLHHLCSSVFAAHPLETFADWYETALALWRKASYREATKHL